MSVAAKYWIAGFAFSLVTAVLVQFLILPQFVPSLHAHDGLMVGGDWLDFHDLAVALLERMRTDPSAWELRPRDQTPAGIAALFYYCFGPHPASLLPLNAALHSLSAVVLMQLLTAVGVGSRAALIASLPCLFSPTAVLWYAQIHKDTYFVPGVLLFSLGWVRLLPFTEEQAREKLTSAIWPMLVGIFLVWLVRPYAMEIVGFAALLSGATFFLFVLATQGSAKAALSRAAARSCLVLIVPLLVAAIPRLTGHSVSQPEGANPETPAEIEQIGGAGPAAGGTSHVAPGVETKQPPEDHGRNWIGSRAIPPAVDSLFRSLYTIRENTYRGYPNAASAVDREQVLNSPAKMLLYLPRAIVVGMFAPFPTMWLGEGSSAASGFMRKVNAVEMAFNYVCLIGLVAAVVYWRRDPRFWALLVLTFTMLMVSTYSLPVVGTLHRFRFSQMVILIGLGIAAGGAARLSGVGHRS